MSRWRGEVHEEGLALRYAIAEKNRGLARYHLPPYTSDPKHNAAALRLIEAADEIEHGGDPLRMCVRHDSDGPLSVFSETCALPGQRGRWVDVHADGRMTAVPAAWAEWHENKLAALRRASRLGAEAALAAGAEWDLKEPK